MGDDFRACLEGKFDTEYESTSHHLGPGHRADRGINIATSNLVQYQYPNTLRLQTMDSNSESDSDSGSEHRGHRQMEHQLTDKIKDIFSKKKRHRKYTALNRRGSHSAESPRNGPRTSRGRRSEHRGHRDQGQYALPSSMEHVESNP